VTPQEWINAGAIYHCDTTGVFQWTFPLPARAVMIDFPKVDPSGNIVIAFDTAGINAPVNAAHLLKLSPAGQRLFEITIPQIVPGANQLGILGPVIAANGNIWILGQATNLSGHETATSSISFAYEDAMLFDGTTGNILVRKNIFEGLFQKEIAHSDGSSSEYSLNNGSLAGPTLFVKSTGNNLVAGGFFEYLSNSCRSNGLCKQLEKSEWRMTLVDQAGNSDLFRYHGNGTDIGSSGNGQYKGDGEGNELSDIEVGTSNILYLHGTVTKGKNVNGVGNLQYMDVLMRFNAATNKIEWKIVKPIPPGYGPFPTFFYEPSQTNLRQRDNTTIDIYNSAGAVSATPLIFSTNVFLSQPSGEYEIRNIENGAIILRSGDQAGEFMAKYAIGTRMARQNFTKRIALFESPYQYSLSQNYPNPFNPATTIEFELAGDALVTIRVYNTIGQEVATLADGEEFSEGTNAIGLDASNLSSGVYYYRITARDAGTGQVKFATVKKMMLVK
jgi:hypothetical protein